MKKHIYTFIFDLLWAAFCVLLASLIMMTIRNYIDTTYFYTLVFCVALGLFYFKNIILPETSFLFSSVVSLLLIFLLNFKIAYDIFFIKLHYYLDGFENYFVGYDTDNFTSLSPDLGVRQLLLVKSITVYSFIFVLFLIFLTQIRIVWLLMRKARKRFSTDSNTY